MLVANILNMLQELTGTWGVEKHILGLSFSSEMSGVMVFNEEKREALKI